MRRFKVYNPNRYLLLPSSKFQKAKEAFFIFMNSVYYWSWNKPKPAIHMAIEDKTRMRKHTCQQVFSCRLSIMQIVNWILMYGAPLQSKATNRPKSGAALAIGNTGRNPSGPVNLRLFISKIFEGVPWQWVAFMAPPHKMFCPSPPLAKVVLFFNVREHFNRFSLIV